MNRLRYSSRTKRNVGRLGPSRFCVKNVEDSVSPSIAACSGWQNCSGGKNRIDWHNLARWSKKIVLFGMAMSLGLLTLTGCESLSNSSVRNSEGVDYYTRGQYQAAQETFLDAIELDPNNAEAYYNLASTYQQQANLNQQPELLLSAENYYQLCLEKNPSSDTTICCYRGLATTMNQRGQGDKALALLRDWESRNVNSIEPKLEIAYLLEAQGKYEEATSELKKVAVLSPNDYRAYYKLGGLRQKNGDTSAALNDYLMASRLNPSDESLARQVVALQAQVDHEEAQGGQTQNTNQETALAAGKPADKTASGAADSEIASQETRPLSFEKPENSAPVENSQEKIAVNIVNDPSSAQEPSVAKNEPSPQNSEEPQSLWVSQTNSAKQVALNDSASYSNSVQNSSPAALPDGTGENGSTPTGNSAGASAENASTALNSDSSVGEPIGSLLRQKRMGQLGGGPPAIRSGSPF